MQMKYIYEFRSPGLTQQLFLDYRKKLECNTNTNIHMNK